MKNNFLGILIFVVAISGCAHRQAAKKIQMAEDKISEAKKIEAPKNAADSYEPALRLLYAAKNNYSAKKYDNAQRLADESAKKSETAISDSLKKILDDAKSSTERTLKTALKNNLIPENSDVKNNLNMMINTAESAEKAGRIKDAVVIYKRINDQLNTLLKPLINDVCKWQEYAKSGLEDLVKKNYNNYLPEKFKEAETLYNDGLKMFKETEDYAQTLKKFKQVSGICVSLEERYNELNAKKAMDKAEKMLAALEKTDEFKNNSKPLDIYRNELKEIKVNLLTGRFPDVINSSEKMAERLDYLLKNSASVQGKSDKK